MNCVCKTNICSLYIKNKQQQQQQQQKQQQHKTKTTTTKMLVKGTLISAYILRDFCCWWCFLLPFHHRPTQPPPPALARLPLLKLNLKHDSEGIPVIISVPSTDECPVRKLIFFRNIRQICVSQLCCTWLWFGEKMGRWRLSSGPAQSDLCKVQDNDTGWKDRIVFAA